MYKVVDSKNIITVPDAGLIDASTGIITLNNFNPDEATNIRLTIAPKSLDLAPKRNQIINIDASRIFVTGSIDNIAYSGPSGAIEYSTNSRLR